MNNIFFFKVLCAQRQDSEYRRVESQVFEKFLTMHKLRQFLRFGCVNIVSTDDDDDFEIEKRSSTTQTVSLLLC